LHRRSASIKLMLEQSKVPMACTPVFSMRIAVQ
jgi:hypothetical protein